MPSVLRQARVARSMAAAALGFSGRAARYRCRQPASHQARRLQAAAPGPSSRSPTAASRRASAALRGPALPPPPTPPVAQSPPVRAMPSPLLPVAQVPSSVDGSAASLAHSASSPPAASANASSSSLPSPFPCLLPSPAGAPSSGEGGVSDPVSWGSTAAAASAIPRTPVSAPLSLSTLLFASPAAAGSLGGRRGLLLGGSWGCAIATGGQRLLLVLGEGGAEE